MTIELLYPDVCNLLGEHGSIRLLECCFGEDVITTSFPNKPHFLTEPVDFVYMGPMTERMQRRIAALWRPLADDLRAAIARGQAGFFAGNALDLLGRHVIYEEGDTVPMMGLYPFDTYCRRYDRENTIVAGIWNGIEVMGYQSRFTIHTGDTSVKPFIRVTTGTGMNPETDTEGICDGNFFATDLLGPFLVLNPDFTDVLFRRFGYEGDLPFEAQLRHAARIRFEDLTRHLAKRRK